MIYADYDIARAAGEDSGNRNMRANGRTEWNEDDWNVAAQVCREIIDGIIAEEAEAAQ